MMHGNSDMVPPPKGGGLPHRMNTYIRNLQTYTTHFVFYEWDFTNGRIGNALSGVTVTVDNTQTGVSDSTGTATVTGLTAGTHAYIAKKSGYMRSDGTINIDPVVDLYTTVVMMTAMSSCNMSMQRVFDKMQNKKIDISKITDIIPSDTPVNINKWFRSSNSDRIRYINTNTANTEYDIGIMIKSSDSSCPNTCNMNPVGKCMDSCGTDHMSCVMCSTTIVDITVNPPVFSLSLTVPDNIIDNAMSTLPMTSGGGNGGTTCGTGIWDGCAIGDIQNKWLIMGGGALVTLLLLTGKKKR